ncbi:MAG: hypothetical protein FP816_00695 [Desulfobacteraceae bacterium]|nr:hypothetical protein [Desulfobacteraceae bacterium]MBU4053228.1 hypothetical protein [Pseudomonadota bacterium]
MKIKWFSYKMVFLFLVSSVFILLTISPIQAYDYGNWNIDGIYKGQYGVFTDKKPFNKPEYGGSDDNTATSKQMLRWNLNGQVTSNISIRAEVMGVWEPDYVAEKGTYTVGVDKNAAGEYIGYTKRIRNNLYNSFDWRELTVEYKPSLSHTFRFGRQIINWGEAISGRVIDQCNPVDARTSGGILGLDETYMPLWMFRGIHDFYSLNSTFEWIIAPIWQADRYENSRGVGAWPRYGDGRTTNTGTAAGNRPWVRYANNNEARVDKFYGASVLVNRTGAPANVYGGAPFGTGYHGSDLLPGWQVGDPIRPLTYAEALSGTLNPSGFIFTGNDTYLTDANVIWTEIPSTSGEHDKRFGMDNPDHNFKNTRWGFKTKHMLGQIEGGVAFFQGPGSSTTYRYNHLDDQTYRTANGITGTPSGRLIYQKVIPRYNTMGIYGNYQFPWAVFMFESAYMPDREYHKNLMGIGVGNITSRTDQYAACHAARLNGVAEVDVIQTLLGFTREQNIPFLNKYNVFTLRFQYTATNYLQSMDDITLTTYFMKYDQMGHNLTLTTSTAYSYNKYSPSLTISADPNGAAVIIAGFTYVPEGFNTRLRFSLNWTNYWTANEYTSTLSLPDQNDSVSLGMQYSFY